MIKIQIFANALMISDVNYKCIILIISGRRRAKFEDFGFRNEQISMNFSAYKARKTVFRTENPSGNSEIRVYKYTPPLNKILNHNRILFDISSRR